MSNPNFLNSVQMTAPGKNVFDLSHDHKTTTDAGRLTPILTMEALPGDYVNLGADILLRFAPMLAPVMHRVDCYTHFFIVPLRVLWPRWEEFATQTKVGPTVPEVPYLNVDSTNWSKLLDYQGIPKPNPSTFEKITAFQAAAYQHVVNEYYRDENLIDEIDWSLGEGGNRTTQTDLFEIRYRAWEKDYFTGALPFAQKGDAVSIPIGLIDMNVPVLLNATSGTELTGTPANALVGGAVDTAIPDDSLYAETVGLSVESTTINELRRAYRLQEWLEKNARGGTRYTEHIRAHFGVISSDARMQRAQYITGSKTPVVISEVLNMTGTEEAPQGGMAGHGVSVSTGRLGGVFVEEHSIIIGILSVMPKPAYQQGIPKQYLKYTDQFQYYYPEFANLGEQEIQMREIYAFDPAGGGNNVFGYMVRYGEYRVLNNMVSGSFRDTLDFWHWGRKFSTTPALNQQFIECKPGKRIFAVEDEEVDSLYVHAILKIRATRPIPKYGTPTT